jgi:hypothetical protein
LHGCSGQLYRRYQDGTEDRIGALGLVLNAVVLFTTKSERPGRGSFRQAPLAGSLSGTDNPVSTVWARTGWTWGAGG